MQVVDLGEISLELPSQDDACWMKVGSDQFVDGDEAEEEATDQTVSTFLNLLKPKTTSLSQSSGSVRAIKPGSCLRC